jgi:MscS family membrane protein
MSAFSLGSLGRKLCLLVVFAALAPVFVRAQEPPLIPGLPTARNAAKSQPATTAEEAEPVEPEFASARATIRTFLESFNKTEAEAGSDPLRLAARCLDLGDMPQSLWESKGRELAIHLKTVIDRIEYIDFGTVPAEPDGEPWVFYSSPEGEIAIARSKSGRWLFTRSTVAAIPSLLRALESRRPVRELRNEPKIESRYQQLRRHIPVALREEGFLLEHWQWIALAVFAISGWIVWRGVGWLLAVTVGRLIRRRWESLTAEQVLKGFNPVGLLLMAVLWLYALSWLGLPLWIHTVLLVAMRFVAVIATVWAVFGLLELFMLALRKRASMADSTIDLLLVPLVRTSMRLVITIVAIAVFANNFDVEITGLLAGLGLGGVAIALAAKDTLGNFFGSLTVILDKPFRAGDWVKIGTVEGQVEEVGLRSTRIRTAEDSLVTMPNLTLTATAVENFGMRRWRRWKTTLVLGHSTPPDRIDKLCEGILELVSARPATMRQDGSTAAIGGFSPSAIEISVVVFFAAPDAATENRLRHEFALELLRLAERLEVEFEGEARTVIVMPQEKTGEHPDDPGTAV